MDGAAFLIVLIFLGMSAYFAYRAFLRRDVVWDTEFALLYRNGQYSRRLEPGVHWIFPMRDSIRRLDARPRFRILSGQEILTKDRVAIKISLSIIVVPTDPETIFTSSVDAEADLLEHARVALRDLVSQIDLDEILNDRKDLPEKMHGLLDETAAASGYKVSSIAVRDIMLPGNLKRAYAGVLEAKKDAERRLELARGEQAVMRSLANTAKLIDGNPALMQVRLLQAAEAGDSTIVFGADGLAGAEPLGHAKARK